MGQYEKDARLLAQYVLQEGTTHEAGAALAAAARIGDGPSLAEDVEHEVGEMATDDRMLLHNLVGHPCLELAPSLGRWLHELTIPDDVGAGHLEPATNPEGKHVTMVTMPDSPSEALRVLNELACSWSQPLGIGSKLDTTRAPDGPEKANRLMVIDASDLVARRDHRGREEESQRRFDAPTSSDELRSRAGDYQDAVTMLGDPIDSGTANTLLRELMAALGEPESPHVASQASPVEVWRQMLAKVASRIDPTLMRGDLKRLSPWEHEQLDRNVKTMDEAVAPLLVGWLNGLLQEARPAGQPEGDGWTGLWVMPARQGGSAEWRKVLSVDQGEDGTEWLWLGPNADDDGPQRHTVTSASVGEFWRYSTPAGRDQP